ncbi:spore coat polysaccharide biosynthesis predicted glycosyltransferase SpsG [Desulfobaculum xiamenense]|uniref:Spore coat polysaccharide biosynthesis predicted glycosyltransferase SpsG n=1 Tax=Desulfobaculum xiamenense TaxID=995050 RepID=A0A846QX53_9BACT|nr:hypothetical protein [Desulfobaculum xiamenense]NJB69199.1 spore coat polysaccharide biosynthesis predicted glycosyltransferase SpsG [Desulfobaculum xiamenense]
MTLVLIAEGRREIGLGHVFACMALAGAGRAAGMPTRLLGIGDLALATMRRFGDAANAYDADEETLAAMGGEGPDIAVVDVRRPEEFDFAPLARAGYLTCALEEFGEGRPEAMVMVNPAPVRAWHRLPDGYRAVLSGLSYLPVRPEYAEVHERARAPMPQARRVLVTMGGVDRTGATLVMARALGLVHAERPELVGVARFVCGPGFTYAASLDRLLAESDLNSEVLTDVPDMWERFFEADLVISAGGNTLFEAACCGAPSVVFWEDPHERERGEAAEAAGFARCFGRGQDTAPVDAARILEDVLDDGTWLAQAGERGRQAVDGRGASRIVSALVGLCGGRE